MCDGSPDSIQKLNSLIKHPNWSAIIKYTDILVNGEFTTIEKFLKSNNQISNSTNETNVEVTSNMMYIAVSCKYANFFYGLLQFIPQCISSCQKLTELDTGSKEPNQKNTCINSILINFIDFKSYLVKAIFNLLNFKDLSPNLKYSDHSLLMSLFTINMFLERLHTNFTPNEEVNDVKSTEENIIKPNFEWSNFYKADLYYNKVLFQMKHLIDKFRYNHCNCTHTSANLSCTIDKKIYDNPTDDLTTTIKTKFTRHLLQWKSLNDFGVDTEIAYNVKMFDMQYLLLQKMFDVNNSYFEHLFMKFNMKEKLIQYANKMFAEVKKNLSVKNVIQYQIFLIELIRSIFLVKAEYISRSLKKQMNRIRPFSELLKSFRTFVNKFIPDNYPPDFYRYIIDTKNKLIYIRKLSIDTSPTNVVEQLRENSIIYDDRESSIKDISMMEFIKNITELEHFKTFRQTFEVLLQDSSALDDYNLFQRRDHEVQVINSNDENDMCNHMSAVREHLILFYVLLYQMDTYHKSIDDPKYCIRLSFHSIFKYMARIFQDPIYSKLQNIFIPVLIHFKNTEWIFHYDDESTTLKKAVVLKKIILLAVNAIQHIEINSCKTPEFNKDIIHRSSQKYSGAEIVLSKTSNRIIIYNILTRLAFESRTYRPRNAEKVINNILDKYMFNDILKDVHGAYAKEIQFMWYGFKKNIYQIGQDVLQSIVSYRRLIKFQCLVQKWLVSKIFIELGYVFKFPINVTYYRIAVILQELKKLDSLILSSSLIANVRDIVELYTKIFDNGGISEDHIEQYHIKIENTFKIDGIIVTKENKFNKFSDLYQSLINDIKTLSNHFLSYYHELLIFEDDHSIKMFWDEKDKKDIE